MTQNVDRETVVSRLLAADDILILCHKNPDGDTIGSGTALCLALQQLGKNAAVLCSDPIPAMYDYMPITVFDGSFSPAFVVAVDVAGIQLFGERNNIRDYAEHVNLCIDHHGSNSGYAYETLVDDHAAAAAELLTTLIPEMGAKITPEIAACTRAWRPTPAASGSATRRRRPTARRRRLSRPVPMWKSSTSACSRAAPTRGSLPSGWRWKAWNFTTTTAVRSSA